MQFPDVISFWTSVHYWLRKPAKQDVLSLLFGLLSFSESPGITLQAKHLRHITALPYVTTSILFPILNLTITWRCIESLSFLSSPAPSFVQWISFNNKLCKHTIARDDEYKIHRHSHNVMLKMKHPRNHEKMKTNL